MGRCGDLWHWRWRWHSDCRRRSGLQMRLPCSHENESNGGHDDEDGGRDNETASEGGDAAQ